MKINIVLPAIGHSGGIDVIYKYTELLESKGYDVLIYKEIKAFNMKRYSCMMKNRAHQLYCTLKAIRESKKIKGPNDCFVFSINDRTVRDADVILATSWPTAFLVNKLSNCKGKKYYFIQGYEVWDNEDLGKESYRLPLQKIVISTWINEQLKKNLQIGPFPIIYNGLDTTKYINRNKIYKKKEDTINFLMLNHELEIKGVKQGLQAYEAVKKQYSNVRLKMFGNCSGQKLPEYVEYIQNPSQEELLSLYCETDIFLFPSLEEGWGLTPLEAMACKCVVVGTRTGYTLDIGEHKRNMMISEPGDIEGMVNNICELLDDIACLKQMAENARLKVELLDWNSSCDELINIFTGRKQ